MDDDVVLKLVRSWRERAYKLEDEAEAAGTNTPQATEALAKAVAYLDAANELQRAQLAG
jgi:hypothetical protein